MLPLIQGVIARRMLLNFRADPNVVQRLLPAPLQVDQQHGHAIVGVCLIRLENLRPQGIPGPLGLSCENMAHRVAIRYQRRWHPPPECLSGAVKRIKDWSSCSEDASFPECITHEFEKARFYSAEESKERENLHALREKHKLTDSAPGIVGLKDIEEVIARWETYPYRLSKE